MEIPRNSTCPGSEYNFKVTTSHEMSTVENCSFSQAKIFFEVWGRLYSTHAHALKMAPVHEQITRLFRDTSYVPLLTQLVTLIGQMIMLHHSHSISENTGLETQEKVLFHVFVHVFFVGRCTVLRSRHMEKFE